MSFADTFVRMRMSSSAVVAVATSLGLVACVGGSSARRGAVDGAAGNQGADGAVSDTPIFATLAGNGVRIPPPDPKNNCDALDVHVATCEVGVACAPLTCDCPSGPLVLTPGFGCATQGCASSVACSSPAMSETMPS